MAERPNKGQLEEIRRRSSAPFASSDWERGNYGDADRESLLAEIAALAAEKEALRGGRRSAPDTGPISCGNCGGAAVRTGERTLTCTGCGRTLRQVGC